MKNSKILFKTIFLALTTLLVSCEEKEYEFGDIIAPSNLDINSVIVGQDTENPYGDGSGAVNFTASAADALTYKYIYNGKEEMAPTGELTIDFSTTGINNYNVTVQAFGKAGVSTTETIEVEVLALYSAPDDLLEMLYGDGEKTWRVKAESVGHFGVGPADGTSPDWWAAPAYDKSGLGAYDDRITFKSDGTVTYTTNGTMYGQAAALDADYGISWEANSNSEYENYPVDEFSDTWSLTAPEGQETLNFDGNGFHGFYVGGDHSYAILERTDTEMTIKTIGADGLGWFGILTSEDEPSTEEASVDVTYSNLIWSDEFDTDGAPDTTKWTYDIGTGSNGWGNNESQYYTNRVDNVTISEGTLKITAKKESYEGSEYTSARMKTQDLFEFTHGRVDVRAKLPAGGGTWPALWMLGANFETVNWPACGEIDIMEHVGNDEGTVHGSIHNASSSGATVNTGETTVSDATSEFHVYSVNWSEDEISFLVDDEIFYTYSPDPKDGDTWPFDTDQFIIMNVAMGGNFGGAIDASFTEATMEVDYVRVYQ
ncbi:glycoside hydrolase family 16 protein [Maribacter sp. ANRC-HE7]|uniref:Glycoside hydrolase family 16 protein n=1 Tax=Maribacter aquimaris TaxID=2737171 RepID=A0ABR7V2K2_9FLAO|nr:glycoside hydrolase family 16 protein [Maribacter aquimaris]MBD0778687.1 glycoside hydrolase family 16 protein [Maribacter aquimaris]